MYTPTLEQVKTLAQQGEGNLVPVYREISADLETPVSAFLKIARGDFSFLLESVEGGETVFFEFTFDEAGEYGLICTPHEAEGMVGTIIVE